jgi:Cof subfamily protein (haloacid dehalogenase superfamily)
VFRQLPLLSRSERSTSRTRYHASMIRLVCIDVDGTLVGGSGVVAEATWAAAERARARGIRLAVCTGRPGFGRGLAYATRLDPDGWHIFQNGSSVVHLPNGETRSGTMPAESVAWLIERARATGRALELYGDADYVVESASSLAAEHAALLDVPFLPRPYERFHAPIVRGQWVVTHADAAAVVAEPHDGLTVAVSLSPIMPHAAFVNVTPAGIDKGDALRRVADAYGLSPAEVMMVGDSDNDVPALRVAGLAVAMGNAEPAVLDEADRVVAHVDHGGLIEALVLAVDSWSA